MDLTINFNNKISNIILEKGCIKQLYQFIDKTKKVLLITDDGVPQSYVQSVLSQVQNANLIVIEQGEKSKCFKIYEDILKSLLDLEFSRNDIIIALGGGVVIDIAGFVASSYMRGIEYINIPTTTISQIDSSVGGKVGLNLSGVKNVIGAFHQPSLVLIDTLTLKSLDNRNFLNGIVEAIKCGLIYDKTLFELLENDELYNNIDTVILKSLNVKREIVQMDEQEIGIRKILNFGHTVGHAIESDLKLSNILHGEAVAVGMLYVIDDKLLKQRLINLYQKLGIKFNYEYNKSNILNFIRHDKKILGNKINIIKVSELGQAYIMPVKRDDIEKMLDIKGD